jgi:hypothetical protein
MVTVTLQDSVLVFFDGYVILHLIVAVPLFTEVTTPFLVTVAIALFDVLHL